MEWCMCVKTTAVSTASNVDLIRQAPRSLEGAEFLDETIKGYGRSTGLLLPNIVTIPDIHRLAIQLLLPDDQDEVILGQFTVPDLLLKRVLPVVDICPEPCNG